MRKALGVWLPLACCMVVAVAAGPAAAADGKQLQAALAQMMNPTLDETSALTVENLTLTQADFSYTLEKGTLYFFTPVVIDSAPTVYGAFFSGRAKLNFSPRIPMERDQLHRFFGRDSLNEKCMDAILLFTGQTVDSLKAGGRPAKPLSGKPRKAMLQRFEELQKLLAIREDHTFLFAALRNVANPRRQPFLLVDTDMGENDQVFYVYDPYAREEVRFHRFFKQFMVPFFMEPVCSYSIYADSTYAMLNGMDKALIRPLHYSLTSAITNDGYVTTTAIMKYEAEVTPVQLLELTLHERLFVDSIRTSEGDTAQFVRWTNDRNRNTPLLVILPQPLDKGRQSQLVFYYHGPIIHRQVSDLYVDVRSNWYPIYDNGFTEPVTFDMRFQSPTRYGLVATGDLVTQEIVGDTLTTVWKTDTAVFDASFCIGNYTRYQFTLDSLPTLDVYYLEKLHRDSTERLVQNVRRDTSNSDIGNMQDVRAAGGKMHEQVANDVISALKLYTQRFGELSFGRIAASEFLDTITPGARQRKTGTQSPPGMRFADRTFGRDRFSAEQMGVDEDTSLSEHFGGGRTEIAANTPIPPGPSYTNLVLLRFDTFQRTDQYGRETRYRAQGVADQWWRQSIAPAYYRDEWIGTGLAAYSALLYLQVSRGNDQFNYWIDRQRQDLISQTSFSLGSHQDLGALALGPRAATTKSRYDYEELINGKGAYVIHMLRNMLLDLETLDESRFFAMLHDFYTTFRNRRVTTVEFRAMVEKHTGVEMGWFFDQWVYGSYLPNYKFSYKVSDAPDKGYQVAIRIEQKNVPETFQMFVPIEIELDNGDRQYARVLVNKPVYEETLPVFQSKPKKLRLNPFHSVLAKVDQ